MPAVTAAIMAPSSGIWPVLRNPTSPVEIAEIIVATPKVVVFQFMPLRVCQRFLPVNLAFTNSQAVLVMAPAITATSHSFDFME